LGNADDRQQQEKTQYDPREFLHFTLLKVGRIQSAGLG